MSLLPAAAAPAAEHHVRRRSNPWADLAVCVVGSALLAAATGGQAAALAAAVVLQLALLAAWWQAVEPPGPVAVLTVAGAVAVAADIVEAVTGTAGDLAGVLALGVVATIVGQLARGVARTRVVEAFASTLGLSVCLLAFALLPVTVRQNGTRPVLLAAAAAGTGLILARLADLVVVWPRVVDSVGRGGLGLVAGAAVGGAIGALVADAVVGRGSGALVGALVAVVAVLVDIGGCALLGGLPRKHWAFGLAPLLGLVSVAALTYVVLPAVSG